VIIEGHTDITFTEDLAARFLAYDWNVTTVADANGMALTKLRPYWSGFLIFSDYARGAIRLSALMEIPVLHIFTHDSIGVGEDGPTHQPVEQLASLRAMPGLLVFRPADANEVAETWRVVAGLRREPAALILSRQPLPTFDRSRLGAASGVAGGLRAGRGPFRRSGRDPARHGGNQWQPTDPCRSA
jgi:transketolase